MQYLAMTYVTIKLLFGTTYCWELVILFSRLLGSHLSPHDGLVKTADFCRRRNLVKLLSKWLTFGRWMCNNIQQRSHSEKLLPWIAQFGQCFLNMTQSRPLFCLFSVFLKKKNQCEKCPFSIQYQDSNPQPLKHESTNITTRPGLPPRLYLFIFVHPVYSARIQTHNLSNMSRHPYPLDQGSRPGLYLFIFVLFTSEFNFKLKSV